MDKLLGVAQIMARYGCCRQTASKRMHEMAHMEQPLMVTERAVKEWEETKQRRAANIITIPRRRA